MSLIGRLTGSSPNAAAIAAENQRKAEEAARIAREKAEQARIAAEKARAEALAKEAQARAAAQQAKPAPEVTAAQQQAEAAKADAVARTAEANRLAKEAAIPEPFPPQGPPPDQFVAGRPGSPGAQPPAVAAQAEAQRIAQEAAGDPVRATESLQKAVTGNADPAFRDALLTQAEPAVTDLARQAHAPGALDEEARAAVVKNLESTAAVTSPAQTDVLARAFARGIPESDPTITTEYAVAPPAELEDLGAALDKSFENAGPTAFSASLANELRASGKPNAGDFVSGRVLDGHKAVRNAFEDKRKAFDEVNGKLQATLADLGPAATPEERDRAVTAFRENNQAVFDDFERASADLARQLPALAELAQNPATPPHERDFALETLKDVPSLAQTQSGKAAIADALAAQSRNEPTFLDAVPEAAKRTENPDAYLDTVTDALVTSATARAIDAKQAGTPTQDEAALQGLQKNAAIFRVDANLLSKTVKTLADTKFNGEGGLQDYAARLGANLNQLNTSGTGGAALSKAFFAAGGALGIFASGAGLATLDKQTPLQQLNTYATAAGTTFQVAKTGLVDSGLLNRELSLGVTKYASAAKSLLTNAKVVPGLTALASSISSVDNFQQGKPVPGTADAAIAVGAGLLLVPGAGTLVGGTLIAAGTATKLAYGFFGPEGDEKSEADTSKTLEILGVPPEKAKILSELDNGRHFVGQFVAGVATKHGITPREYLNHLGTLPNEDLERIVDFAKDVPLDENGRLADANEHDFELQRGGSRINSSNGSVTAPESAIPGRRVSLNSAYLWLKGQGLVPRR